MRIWRFTGVSRVHLTILQCASWLLPSRQREEWTAEWRGELWYVCQRCQGQPSSRSVGDEDPVVFCLGAFQDAFWIRRNSPRSDGPGAFRLESALGCGALLGGLAVAFLMIALLLPGARNAILQSPYRDASSLVLISPDGYLEARSPTISLEEYQAWKHRSQSLFTDFAFYRPILRRTSVDGNRAADLNVAIASDNLFDLLEIPVSSSALEDARREHRTALVLRHSAWRRYFGRDAHVLGRCVEIAGQRAVVVAVVSDDSWRLPGQVDAWLLEDARDLNALPSDSLGYVLGHVSHSANGTEAGRGQWHMLVPREGGYDGFDCVSLAERIREPFSIFLFALMLACLALPATTPLPLGDYPDYPQTNGSLFWATRLRRWIFLSVKIGLIVPIVYCGSLSLAYCRPLLDPITSQYIQIFFAFTGCLFLFRWALRDQRQRCPVCLRLLTNPARVGQPSRNFLSWNGTELICNRGHGLLHVPEIATSWFSTQRWLYLDPSWNVLFHEAYLPSAGMF
jgi:hypothetical protein